jgi:hypothetical protein
MTYPTPPGGLDDGADSAAEAMSERSRGVAMVLALVGGPVGLHRFYAGRPLSGVIMILTLGGLGVWWLYDLIVLATGEFRDAAGRRLRRWQFEDDSPAGAPPRRVDDLTAQVDRLERHVAELAERLDFAERMLTQQRERDRLPRG